MSIVMLMSSCEQLFTYLRVRLQRALLAVVLTILAIQPTSAHIQSEAPWHAVAYAYLNTLFLLNLEPVDWPLIERVLTTDHDGRILGRPASERLIELDQAAGTAHWQAIETALSTRSAATLHAATTRAVSAAIRQHLANAAAALEQPGLARAEIDQAQALFRAFADPVKQTDPEGFRALGLAWLELASSVRQTGVIAAGGLPAGPAGVRLGTDIAQQLSDGEFRARNVCAAQYLRAHTRTAYHRRSSNRARCLAATRQRP